MAGNIATALETLLTTELAGLFTGGDAVGIDITSQQMTIDPDARDAAVGEPRPDDQVDMLPFDPNVPEGPYTLTKPPYPGPRRLRLLTNTGDRLTLRDDEVQWDELDSRNFSLNLGPTRDPSPFTQVQVLYSITAVFTKIKSQSVVLLNLTSADAARLLQARELAISVISLNRQALVNASQVSYSDGDYGAEIELKELHLISSEATESNAQTITLHVDYELKATRALRADEGQPITSIRTPGQAVDPERPVNIQIEVDA